VLVLVYPSFCQRFLYLLRHSYLLSRKLSSKSSSLFFVLWYKINLHWLEWTCLTYHLLCLGTEWRLIFDTRVELLHYQVALTFLEVFLNCYWQLFSFCITLSYREKTDVALWVWVGVEWTKMAKNFFVIRMLHLIMDDDWAVHLLYFFFFALNVCRYLMICRVKNRSLVAI